MATRTSPGSDRADPTAGSQQPHSVGGRPGRGRRRACGLERSRCSSASAAERTRRPGLAGPARPPGSRRRRGRPGPAPRHLAGREQASRRRRPHRVAGDRGQPAGQAGAPPSARWSRGRRSRRVPADQGLQRRVRRGTDGQDRGPGAGQGGGVRPATQPPRPRAGRPRAAARCPADDGGVAAVGDRHRRRGGDDDLGLGPTVRSTRSPELVRIRVPGNARPMAPRRSGRRPARGAQPRWPHSAHAQSSATAPHHRQAGGSVGPGREGPRRVAQRAGVRQRSQAGAATPARSGVWTRTGPVSSARRSTRCTSCGTRRPVARVRPDGDGHAAAGSAVGGQLPRPAGPQEVLGLDRAHEAADQDRSALPFRAAAGSRGCGVRRPRLACRSSRRPRRPSPGRGPARRGRRVPTTMRARGSPPGSRRSGGPVRCRPPG